MYELFILSLLVRFPAHGYLLAKIINDMIGPYAKISNGRLYPLLAKLEESGLIEANEEAEQQGERNSRSYRITEDGRERFHALMMDTTSNLGEYQRIFSYKVPVLYLLKPFERIYLIDHYINYCQAHVLHLTAEIEDLAANAPAHYKYEGTSLEDTLAVMKHVADFWRREVEWAQQLRQKELARRQDEEQANNASQQRRREQHQNQNRNDNQNQNPSPNRNQQ